MFGPDILVAPVAEAGAARSRAVYLPAGDDLGGRLDRRRALPAASGSGRGAAGAHPGLPAGGQQCPIPQPSGRRRNSYE